MWIQYKKSTVVPYIFDMIPIKSSYPPIQKAPVTNLKTKLDTSVTMITIEEPQFLSIAHKNKQTKHILIHLWPNSVFKPSEHAQ